MFSCIRGPNDGSQTRPDYTSSSYNDQPPQKIDFSLSNKENRKFLRNASSFVTKTFMGAKVGLVGGAAIGGPVAPVTAGLGMVGGAITGAMLHGLNYEE